MLVKLKCALRNGNFVNEMSDLANFVLKYLIISMESLEYRTCALCCQVEGRIVRTCCHSRGN
jgi:hypothetical protein